MYDLLTVGPKAVEQIRKEFPHARITDSGDEIHPDRWDLELPDAQLQEFFVFAINHGFATQSLMFNTCRRLRATRGVVQQAFIEAERRANELKVPG